MNADEGYSTRAPQIHELVDKLKGELAALGTDPSKTVASAPTGASNAVFDLGAVVVDEGGNALTAEDIAGGAVVVAVRLAWTERISGDYDQNGEVNVSDLAPLAAQWRKAVLYDAPALHGGFAQWPSGDPEDDGGLTPPLPSSPTANWRLARVDGDGNAEINISDVMPIAAHWRERSDGYRVYRSAPGDSAFTLLPPSSGGGGSPPVDLTVPRSEAFMPGTSQLDPARPVRLGFSDDEARADVLGSGVYSYYVAAYDAQSETEGPRSPVVSVDTTNASVNSAPTARLTLTPDFAGAPSVITLDASQSYDLDGEISALEWDFDADGTVDYSTSDPAPPAQSSAGTVDSITPGAGSPPLTLSAQFLQGSAQYLYPRVRVVDDEGAASAWQSAKLGLTGWHERVLTESIANHLIEARAGQIAIEPGTGRIVLAANAKIRQITGEEYDTPGLFYIEETPSGPWTETQISVPFIKGDPLYDYVGVRELIFDEQGQPVIFFNKGGAWRGGEWTARRLASGQWEVKEHLIDDNKNSWIFSGYGSASRVGPGRLSGLAIETLNDKPSLNGTPYHVRYYAARYEQGAWTFDFSGYDSAEKNVAMSKIIGWDDDKLRGYFTVFGEMSGGPWVGFWEPGTGVVNPQRLDGGSLSFNEGSHCDTGLVAADGSQWTLWEKTNGIGVQDDEYYLFHSPTDKSLPSEVFDIQQMGEDPPFFSFYARDMYASSRRVGVFVGIWDGALSGREEHWMFEDGVWTSDWRQSDLDSNRRIYITDIAIGLDDEPITVGWADLEDTAQIPQQYTLMEHLDPRVK